MKQVDLHAWIELLGSLLQAELSLSEALELCSSSLQNKELGQINQKILQGLRAGQRLSLLLQTFLPKLPPIALGMFRVGEATGRLGPVLLQLAHYLGETRQLQQKIQRVLVYPCIILVLVLLGALVLATLVLPRFTDLAQTIGGAGGDQLVQTAQALEQGFWFGSICLLFLASCGVFSSIMSKLHPPFATMLGSLILRIPAVGPFLAWQETLRLAWSLEVLVASGCNLNQALEQACPVLKNRRLIADCHNIIAALQHGQVLSKAFWHSAFPPLIRQWLAVAERTGKAQEVFGRIRVWCRTQSDAWIASLNAIIEPGVSLLVGGLVLVFVVGVVLPLLSVYGGLV